MEKSLTIKTILLVSVFMSFFGYPLCENYDFKYVFQNLFLLSKFDSVSKLDSKKQTSSYALGSKKCSEDIDACQLI